MYHTEVMVFSPALQHFGHIGQIAQRHVWIDSGLVFVDQQPGIKDKRNIVLVIHIDGIF